MQRNNSTGLEADGPAEIKREHPNEVKFMRYSFPIALILPFATRFQKYHRQYKTIIFKCFKNNKFFSFNTNNKIYPEAKYVRQLAQGEIASVKGRLKKWRLPRNNHSQPNNQGLCHSLDLLNKTLVRSCHRWCSRPSNSCPSEIKTWSPELAQLVLVSDHLSIIYVLIHFPSHQLPSHSYQHLDAHSTIATIFTIFPEQVKYTCSSALPHLLFPLCKMLFPHKTILLLPLFLPGLC